MNPTSNPYLILLYDNTLEGLLSAIFEVYRLKLTQFDIIPKRAYKEKLFDPILYVRTSKAKANRIKIGLRKKTQQDLLPILKISFHNTAQKETTIFNFVQRVFTAHPYLHTTNSVA